ncbi:MAG: CAP domain-containing protein [Dehalococcoidia bacterium]
MNRWHRLRSYLPLGTLVVFGALAIGLLSGCTVEVAAEIKTYSGINQIRASRGLPPLVADPALVEIARIRSRDMAARGYFSHQPPDGCNYVCLMDQRGVPHAWAGENIAWNTWDWPQTADVAVEMWRKSPGHMENILGCHYTRFGTGVAKGRDGKVYFTMIFDGNRPC